MYFTITAQNCLSQFLIFGEGIVYSSDITYSIQKDD